MSIVLRLQKKCVDSNEDLQSLLREALLISTKLNLNEFKNWVESELHGYKDNKNIPDYRKINQTLYFSVPYHGRIKPEVPNKLSNTIEILPNTTPIGEIESQILHQKTDLLEIPMCSEQIKLLQGWFETEYKPFLVIQKSALIGIKEQVRNVLLEWTLKLEKDNILGTDDLIFSEKEKENAQHIHIENFNGILGNIAKLGNMSTGENSTNIYNENNISNEIDKLITEIKKLGLQDQDQEQVIIDLEDSKKDTSKAITVLGSLLTRSSEFATITSFIIQILGLLKG